MSSVNRFRLVFVLVGLFCVSHISTNFVSAQLRMPFKRHNKTTHASQDLTIKNGPWLIMCTSFTGEQAEQQARILANELRQHRMTTYLYRQTFDHSQSVPGVGWQIPESVKPIATSGGEIPQDVAHLDDPLPEQIKMKTANASKVHEVAVLVGDFPSVDDNKAQKILKKIKMMNVKCMGSATEQSETAGKNRPVGTVERSKGGPLRTAFLLPNPLLPDEYFRRQQVDDFLISINKKVKHSLLDCPGLYSVRVATFRGDSTIDPEKIKRGETELMTLQRTGKSLAHSRLVQAEENAHRLTKLLREKGLEAYEFHDRYESYVCIGSFDWVTRTSNGSVLNNPEIVRLVNSCRPQMQHLPGRPSTLVPKSIDGMPLDAEPAPILVPKADASTRTARRLSILK